MVKKIDNTIVKKISKQVYKYTTENKKTPTKLYIDGVKYNWGEIWYILSYKICHPVRKSFEVPKVVLCEKPIGEEMKEGISYEDYHNQAKRIIKYIENNNGQVPCYVLSTKSKKKVHPSLSIFNESRAVKNFYKDGKFADAYKYDTSLVRNKTLIPSSNPVKKFGHATQSGCNNMGQNNEVYCGPHSMQEVIRNLTGKVISQSQLASWAGTGSGGTGHAGIETAIAKAAKELGVNLSVNWYNFSDLGWDGIKKILDSKNQDCIIHNLYRNQYGHYEVVNAVDSNINVQNSLGNQSCNGCYCGYIEYRTKAEFRSYINGISQKSVMVITRG